MSRRNPTEGELLARLGELSVFLEEHERRAGRTRRERDRIIKKLLALGMSTRAIAPYARISSTSISKASRRK